MITQDKYTDLDQARHRVMELLHYEKHRLTYRKRTQLAVEIGR